MSQPLKIILCILIAAVGVTLIVFTIYYNVNVLIDLNSPSDDSTSQTDNTQNSGEGNSLNEISNANQEAFNNIDTNSVNSLEQRQAFEEEMNQVANNLQYLANNLAQ